MKMLSYTGSFIDKKNGIATLSYRYVPMLNLTFFDW